MLVPVTQPGSELGYSPEPEVVTIVFASDAALKLEAPGTRLEQVSDREARLTVTPPGEGRYQPFSLQVQTPAQRLHVSYHTSRDSRPRALGTTRILVPFATAPKPMAPRTLPPELSGGDWPKGRALFTGKAACFTCHRLRGEGVQVGPDLDNLVHRDYDSVLRDIADPNAAINPDAAAYIVSMADGAQVIGTRLADTVDELQIAQPGGVVAKLEKKKISKTEPLPISLMPPGLEKTLSPEELRDLMTYLLTEKAKAPAAPEGTPAK